jgi:cytochrome c551/c552
MKRILLSLSFASVVAVALTAYASPVKIELPQETGSFKTAPGSEIANGQCLICHSVEYVTTQPALPRAFWASSVKKMQDKFGAPIPADQVDTLVNYLTQNYGVSTNGTAGSTNSISVASSSATDGPSVAMKYGCLACHNVSIKIVGPAYKDIAEKYKADSAANEKISEQIHKGGSGKWGPVIMPPFPQVTPDETRILTAWILSQK